MHIDRFKLVVELVTAMNQAAEQAVPQAKGLVVNAVKSMSIKDAKKILTGGDESATQFFRDKTAAPLALQFAVAGNRLQQPCGEGGVDALEQLQKHEADRIALWQ